MPVPTEVDDLDRLIARLEEDIRRRKKKVEELRKDIEEAGTYVQRCRESKALCLKNLKRLKKLSIVPIQDYRDMLKLYEDNCDLLIQHQNHAAVKSAEMNSIVQNILPFQEGSLIEAKRKRAEWGVVLEFKMKL